MLRVRLMAALENLIAAGLDWIASFSTAVSKIDRSTRRACLMVATLKGRLVRLLTCEARSDRSFFTSATRMAATGLEPRGVAMYCA